MLLWETLILNLTSAISPYLFSTPFSTLELKRRSIDLSNPYSSFAGVSRSRTTPNMQPSYHSSSNSDETDDSSLVSLPPPPPNAHRPLSTFIDTTNKCMDSLQVKMTDENLCMTTTCFSIIR